MQHNVNYVVSVVGDDNERFKFHDRSDEQRYHSGIPSSNSGSDCAA